MNSDIKHALATFIYVISYIFAPIAFVIGVFEGGVVGFVTSLVSSAILAASYVLANQPKARTTSQESVSEAFFWILLGASIAFMGISILHQSWPALAGLIFSSALVLLAWRKASTKTRNRIKRAPPI